MSNFDKVYRANHKRVREELGPATAQLCVEGEDHAARDWSQVHDTDGSENNHFRPMCRSHHQKYDYTEERKAKTAESLRGRSFSDETKAKMRVSRAKQVFSEESKAKMSASKKGVPWTQARRDAQVGRQKNDQ